MGKDAFDSQMSYKLNPAITESISVEPRNTEQNYSQTNF